MNKLLICECGEIIGNNKFKDYIKTSWNPSTPTIGHCNCGLIFNFVDGKFTKHYSSKIELKILAKKFAIRKNLNEPEIEHFLLTIDRLKCSGNLPDHKIVNKAYQSLQEEKDYSCNI